MSRKKRERRERWSEDFFNRDMPEEGAVRAEKEKAKRLRKSRWWQQKTAAGVCEYCQRKVGFAELTIDHILPLSRGGLSKKENIACCCKECNSLKKAMMPIEWQEYLQKGIIKE